MRDPRGSKVTHLDDINKYERKLVFVFIRTVYTYVIVRVGFRLPVLTSFVVVLYTENCNLKLHFIVT